MKRPNTMRKLLATSLAVAGLALAGATVPTAAMASDPISIDGTPREIRQSTALYSTPRLETPTTTGVQAGETVQAYCGFTNAGFEWVKIYTQEQFGFVPSSAIDRGTTGLPGKCPSEVTTVPYTVFSSTVRGGNLLVPVREFLCPANYPFLVNQKLSSGDVTVGITLKAHPRVSAVIWEGKYGTARDGNSYLRGGAAGWINNPEHVDEPVAVTATCTSDYTQGKRGPF